MRLLVLYASDLAPTSRIAPGGITHNLRSYLDGLPGEWEVEVWGVSAEPATSRTLVREIALPKRSIGLRSLTWAGPAARRKIPLSLRYSHALRRASADPELRYDHFDVVVAHRTEYLAALHLGVRRLHPPAIAMIHGSSRFARQAMGPLMSAAHLMAEGVAVRSAAAVALVSGSSLSYYRARYPSQRRRFHWIPNGVDAQRFASPSSGTWRKSRDLPSDARLLVYHGRYDREKGIERLVDVLRILREDGADWHLVCAGVGPLGELLDAAAASWGVRFIHNLGYLTPAEIASVLGAADIGLLLSDFEGLSNGLLESLAAGLPVVGTDVGDNRLVLSRVNENLVSSSDPRELAGKVRWAWIHRAELREQARSAANAFSLASRVRRLTTLFEFVACGRAAEYEPESL